jgi:hypothetical protein
MAISTSDGLVAGLTAFTPRPWHKNGITMAAVPTGVSSRAYTPWYAPGNPGAAVANANGVNGAAVTSNAGALPRSNPASGNAYLANFFWVSSNVGQLYIIDRLWDNSGLSATLTTSQSITSAALPARDVDGTTNGAGVLAAIEWSATGGAGTPSVTLSYTNSAGTSGRTATLTGVTTPPVGTFEIFNLNAGDTGIRSIQAYQASTTRTSGTFHIVLYRVIAMLPSANTNYGSSINPFTGGMPRLYDNTTPQLLLFNSATTAATMTGMYQEAQG